MLRRRAPVARRLDWTLFSAVDRILIAKRWFCIKIWCNISRIASLMLKRRPCGCFYWIVCCHWCDACLLLLRRLSRLDEIIWSDCQIAARHFIEAKYLTESGRTKEMLAILLRARWICGGTAMRSRPSVSAVWLLRGHLIEKNEIFPAFQILFEQISNAGERVLQ